jgi:hypothetical protein
MMGSNQHYLEKADIAVSNLVNEGGYLVTEQEQEFFEIAVEESTILQMFTTKIMKSPTYEIPKMGFSGRFLHAATSSTALTEAQRSKPDLGKTQIVTHEYVGEGRIPYDVVEDAIGNGNFNDVFLKFASKAAARDMEEFALNSDTTSADPDLAKQDGLLKQVTSYTVNAGGVRLTKTPLKIATQTLPSRYLKTQSGRLSFFTSKNACIDYGDSRSNRQTPLGDSSLDVQPLSQLEYNGFPIKPVPLWPENLGGTTDRTTAILLDPKNFYVGMQRGVRIETDRDISAREFKIVMTIRFGFKLAHEPACVQITNLLASAGA